MACVRLLSLSLLFVFSLNYKVWSQPAIPATGVVAGIVTDAQTHEPLPGATVALNHHGVQQRGTTTDEAGRYLLTGLEPGAATLHVRYLGYKPRRQDVTITVRDTLHVSFALAPASIALSAIEIIGESPRAYAKLPGTATKLSPREVELISPIGTQELLEYVPGINAFADDGIGNTRISVGIRGLNPRRSSRVLILEDGVPIQPALYVYPNMYYNPPVERVDRVEVIKGSAAIQYGPQTMGGVINYITSRPQHTPGVIGQITTGTHGYLSLFTEASGWSNGMLTPEVQLLVKRGNGFRENNTFQQYNGTFKLSITPDDTRTYYVKANVNYERSNATYTGLTPYSFQIDPTFNPKDDDLFRVFRASLDVIRDRQYTRDLVGTTRAYASYFDRDWWREYDVFVRPSAYDPDNPAAVEPVPWYTTGDLVRVGGRQRNFGILRTFYVAGVEQQYSLQHALFGHSASLDAGARLHLERFIDDQKIGDAPNARNGIFYRGDPEQPETLEIIGQSQHYETTALALYASEQLQLGALRVVPGLRMELFEQERIDRLQGAQYLDKTSFVLLPGLGLNYALGRGYHLFGGIHRGYTPPSSGTLQITGFGHQIEDGGLDLRPETSWNTELGMRGQLSWLAFEAAAFHLYIEDLVAAGRGTAFKNLGRVRTYGLELGSMLHLSHWLAWLPEVSLSYAYLQTEILDGRIESAVRAGGAEVNIAGNELPYAPHHTVTAGLVKRFDFGLALRTDWHYVSRAYTDFENIDFGNPRVNYNRGDTGPVPAYAVINASARYQLNHRLAMELVVKNLLDEVYIGSRLHSNPNQPEAHLSSGILPGPRRQVNLGLKYRF